jgi:hypothetical protein
MVMKACNPSTREAKAGRIMSSRPILGYTVRPCFQIKQKPYFKNIYSHLKSLAGTHKWWLAPRQAPMTPNTFSVSLTQLPVLRWRPSEPRGRTGKAEAHSDIMRPACLQQSCWNSHLSCLCNRGATGLDPHRFLCKSKEF